MPTRSTFPPTRFGTWATRWSVASEALGVRTVNPGETYTESLEFEVPARLPGDYRILVRTDIFDDVVEGENNRNNTGFSADTMAITVPLLRFDIPLAEQLAQGVSRLFQLDTDPGQTVRIDLDSVNDVGNHTNCMSLTNGYPNRLISMPATKATCGLISRLVIPETAGGRYFILARAGVRIGGQY